MPHFKRLTDKQKKEVEQRIKNLLHASRDCMRNVHKGLFDDYNSIRQQKMCPIPEAEQILQRRAQAWDWRRISFNTADGYYGEAFGVLRGLHILGYGDMYGRYSANDYHNLRWWFHQLEKEVLVEDGFQDGSHLCDHCLKFFGKDGADRTRQSHPEIANAGV